ncbi:phospholipid scramblase, partial [Elysia marginata]
EVMTISRDFKCCAGFPCCADGCCIYPIYVKDRFGQKLGMTRQLNYCCTPHMGIFDESDVLLYEITGPCCECQTPCCKDDVDFPVSYLTPPTPIPSMYQYNVEPNTVNC